jgi:hypothetical protein
MNACDAAWFCYLRECGSSVHQALIYERPAGSMAVVVGWQQLVAIGCCSAGQTADNGPTCMWAGSRCHNKRASRKDPRHPDVTAPRLKSMLRGCETNSHLPRAYPWCKTCVHTTMQAGMANVTLPAAQCMRSAALWLRHTSSAHGCGHSEQAPKSGRGNPGPRPGPLAQPNLGRRNPTLLLLLGHGNLIQRPTMQSYSQHTLGLLHLP